LAQKTAERICTTFPGKVGHWPMNKRLNYGGDLDNRLDTGIFPDSSLLGDTERAFIYGRPM